ncbi:hypothetical protein DDZ18_12865 [Marinicauda salina]|uniref:Lipoprotein n=1 Tax=Marinicauda salina TaxID=2135793 RepID=A0A2U2BRP3_9PROT|nr:DUF6491 family protein [Marinicauda salina]PWE16648.1 hypothetical protein DDZ18_12865 [Marinicauda salina]
MKSLFLTAGAMALAACATATAQQGEDPLAGYERTDEVRRCIPMQSVIGLQGLDDRHLLLETDGGALYLNEVNGRCRGAADYYSILRYDTTVTSFCAGEAIRVIDRTTDSVRGSCTLGEFVRVRETGDAAGSQ